MLGVPIMTLGMGIPIHFATATSMFTMIWTSISGVTRHALAHHVHALQAVLLAAGTVIGAQAGAGFSRRVSARTLRRVFGLVLLAVSLQMIVRFVARSPDAVPPPFQIRLELVASQSPFSASTPR